MVVVVVVVVVGGGGYGSEGATCRRGIINIIFHSSEANLFLNNMFCQVIVDLVSNQDSF